MLLLSLQPMHSQCLSKANMKLRMINSSQCPVILLWTMNSILASLPPMQLKKSNYHNHKDTRKCSIHCLQGERQVSFL